MYFLKLLIQLLILFSPVIYAYDEYGNYDSYDNYYENKDEGVTYGSALKEHAELQLRYQKELSAYEYGSDEYKKKLQSIKNSLIVQGIVKKVDDISDANGLWIEYGDGSEGILSGIEGGTKMGISFTPKSTKKELISMSTKRADIYEIGTKKVLSIAAQYWDWNENDDVPIITDTLVKAGFNVTYKKYESQLSGNINDFKNWQDYGLVLISTHGFASKTRSAIDMNYGLTSNIPKAINEDINAKRLVIWQNNGKTTLLASNKFFEYYNKNLPNTLVYMSACSVGKNSAMGDAFLKEKASSWIGYSDVVKVSFTIEEGSKLFNKLLTKRVEIRNLLNEFSSKEVELILNLEPNSLKEVKLQKNYFKLLEGDLFMHYPFGKIFYEDLKIASERFLQKDISPTGLIAGKR
jgi:hypothetical protein